eukprot:1182765-Prorocentrum_minimum.AAC.3
MYRARPRDFASKTTRVRPTTRSRKPGVTGRVSLPRRRTPVSVCRISACRRMGVDRPNATDRRRETNQPTNTN